ncbi:hypothetical protein ASPZODRAFT_133513 [Penicilliopsis zonata CBS 506.65]|uniref:CNH domain-containing protein n=1 Tax=Penicilliopsis zonata CBS 506.65 TaxID=1073090 RepID=A0A1L9SEX0_9EURO|nr:hypothetical protein ASPZODRAFT_133513 [Penicilliopsis zonata CBS 506.65]OJJ45653.1 hypothetical protein ASPZODRAFT_133513 [Penicilliopsis zonata CBS 506.65]
MASEDNGVGPRKKRRVDDAKAAPYVLRQLLDKVPLATEDHSAKVIITCVEYWNENLYIGTSAGEILHFVCLPADPSDESNEPSFILASRLPIRSSQNSPTANGVQQILLLPMVNKACILCNGVTTFYLLPELSPAFGNTKVSHCRWLGGLDLNRMVDDPENPEKPVIMIAVQNRIMLVRIGDEARLVRNIEFPGCLVASRRGTIACVADPHTYSLLEVEHQQKIPLFPISSSQEVVEISSVEDERSPPASHPSSPPTNSPGHHTRNTSLNAIVNKLQQNQSSTHGSRPESVTPDLTTTSGASSRSSSRGRERTISPSDSNESRPRSSQPPQSDGAKPLPPLPKLSASQLLRPHIVSPTASEFLLVTGTEKSEPGVGMFVNIDGDVVRGTINFHRYPDSLIIDGSEDNDSMQTPGALEEYVIAVMDFEEDGKTYKRLEVQRWDVDPGEDERPKAWLDIPLVGDDSDSAEVVLRHTNSPSQLEFTEVSKLLRMVRLKTPLLSPSQKGGASSERGWEAERDAEEAKFARSLGGIKSSLIMWSGDQIWRLLRNPLTVQLDSALQNAQTCGEDGTTATLQRNAILSLMQSIKTAEPRSEAEYLGLNYAKQKASLLLFGDLLFMESASTNKEVIKSTEKALVDGNLDPRILLLLVPLLRCEVLQGPKGIWIHAGLAAVAEDYTKRLEKEKENLPDGDVLTSTVLNLVKRFLLSWQQKRGYGSITDETYVFDSVDAALLHLLLEQVSSSEQNAKSAAAAAASVRTELNQLVDSWKGNFERAVALLEEYRRLYVLSRLYQSRKMFGNVLKTWRRIVDGEPDAGSEVTTKGIEAQMRRYLVRTKDAQLVEEYGSWLAARNPSLGVQVFADNTSRVKLEPTDVVALLKKRAPNAVQIYLEYLVFSKNYTQYADDLISYYLDTVLSVLESSPAARTSLSESYSTYRALRPPKPTYLNFITENTPAEAWWQSRLRLLQLLAGGSLFSKTASATASSSSSVLTYSIPAVLARIEPFQNELVSESIILDGLQGRHREALRLLTHGLGDYDSAIRYCLLGGPRGSSGGSADANMASKDLQRELFRHLLHEFLAIRDLSDRLDRTSDLLARFAAWFDVGEVLALVPDEWSVEILGGFLMAVLRSLVAQGREARIERALCASLNLRVGCEYIEVAEKEAFIEEEGGVRRVS